MPNRNCSKSISADVDLLKHYMTQAPRLKNLRLEFEASSRLVVELGKLVGGLIKTNQGAPAEMDADHVTAWSKGGATSTSNCQMLCKTHNRAKGNR